MDRAIDHAARVLHRQWEHALLWLWDTPDPEGRFLSEGQRANLIHRCLELWYKAPDWATLLELNRRFLERRLPACASFPRPPERETDSFANILRLHNYGLLTTDSCPGWKEDLERQRAYLYFSITTQTPGSAMAPSATQLPVLGHVIRHLLEAPDIRAYIQFQYTMPSPKVRRDPEIVALLQPGGGSRHSLPRPGDPEWRDEGWELVQDQQGQVLGFSFVHRLKRSSIQQPWLPSPDIGMYSITEYGSDFHDDAAPIPASWDADPLRICVVARNLTYRRIGQLIEQLLEEAGVKRCF